MSILKVAHYYQIKLAMAGQGAYNQLLALQAEVNKLTTVSPDIYESTDQQIAELAEKMKPINTAISDLKNKVNSLVYDIRKNLYITSSDLKFRIDKIKEVMLKLAMLGYAKKTAPSLSLANKVQIVNIDLVPESETHTPPGLKITPSKVKTLEYGSGGLPGPPDPSQPSNLEDYEQGKITTDLQGNKILDIDNYEQNVIDPSRTPKSIVVDRVGTTTVTPMKWNPKYKK